MTFAELVQKINANATRSDERAQTFTKNGAAICQNNVLNTAAIS